MAIATGAHTTFDEDNIGNREDLGDIIFNVAPTETPLLTMMKKKKASAVNHEWLQDTLAAAADNKGLEGGEFTGVAAAARVRRNNYCQILKKEPVVSGTQESVDKAGVKSEMAYQVGQRMREIKRDMEFAMTGQSNAKVAGDSTTEREMGSVDAYLKTNNVVVSPSTSATGDGTDVSDYAGTNTALTETILNTALSNIFTNSGGNSSVNMLMTAATKKVFSTFTGAGTRYAATDDKQLVASLDVYVGDFHTVRAMPSRFCKTGLAFIIDPEYIALAELRRLYTIDIAKTGDSIKKELIWEATLEVSEEKAHALIGDLTT